MHRDKYSISIVINLYKCVEATASQWNRRVSNIKSKKLIITEFAIVYINKLNKENMLQLPSHA